MYWNDLLINVRRLSIRLIETWDVLKLDGGVVSFCFLSTINRNMRCIEMHIVQLIATGFNQINRNMRCIEIYYAKCPSFWNLINRNMRCIEINAIPALEVVELGLIETWDVLKSCTRFPAGSGKSMINRNMRCIEISVAYTTDRSYIWLIETWDVLKSK